MAFKYIGRCWRIAYHCWNSFRDNACDTKWWLDCLVSGPAWHRDEHYPHSLHKPGFHKRYELALDVVLSLAEAGIPGSIPCKLGWNLCFYLFLFEVAKVLYFHSKTCIERGRKPSFARNIQQSILQQLWNIGIFWEFWHVEDDVVLFRQAHEAFICAETRHPKKNLSPQNPPNVIHNLFETEKPLIPWPWTLELWLISLLERLRQNVAGESVCLRVSFYSTYYTCKHCMIHNIFLL